MVIRHILPKELFDTVYVRFRDNRESFPIAPSGKRDIRALIEEGMKNAVPC